jgi:hypothetical protein
MYMHIHKAIIVFRAFQKGWVRLIPFARSEVLTIVLLKIQVFRDVILYSWVVTYPVKQNSISGHLNHTLLVQSNEAMIESL